MFVNVLNNYLYSFDNHMLCNFFLFFQESVNNKELRMYLKKMEKQITDLQRRQSKVLGGVVGTNY